MPQYVLPHFFAYKKVALFCSHLCHHLTRQDSSQLDTTPPRLATCNSYIALSVRPTTLVNHKQIWTTLTALLRHSIP